MDKVDLDLSYITDNIIAMGYPSEGLEAYFRNDYKTVKQFLDRKHPLKYKVYNLCAEESKQYPSEKFHKQENQFCFYDHHIPPFHKIILFCRDVESHMDLQKGKNVTVVHCKAGKGRTGVMISAYLLNSKMFNSAKNALKYYGLMRT
jgi:phosphatidylinositol-3,4,5-trisphosphate 3-phosphatase and dual-specificity protein phosphatase PTEN